MAEVNLQEVHDTLVSIAFEAGRMILAANPSSISTDTKLNGMYIYVPLSNGFPVSADNLTGMLCQPWTL
jgi:hypothetical protein